MSLRHEFGQRRRTKLPAPPDEALACHPKGLAVVAESMLFAALRILE
jgi:hypothetical protein